MRIIIFNLLFICLSTAGFATTEVSLIDRMATAKPGDYGVISLDRTVTLLRIESIQNKVLTLEELSVPESFAGTDSWREWYRSGSSGASSHLLHLFNLKDGRLLRTYSYSQMAWMDPGTGMDFFTTLITLPFKEVGVDKRRRIGIPPL